ncbi:tRNA pseudouridine(38-40) synthase TruA [Legionella longbeachae]|uniref:tRNA pseudouridine synthase A n=1 Tax=Legionella longbeachae serogroup 1 (strain NSW150) TaxID=661367 RepID=D3HRK0_LEGLN|nr:tRNA pseudouridine(38-40) synthase TruA [Legionella longbeachae]VEE02033.1 tRNA-pseudouridine synthase I [Legionella oakridgensis]HBD7396718.1 tRNA pseudouridine(38-40) synthase TruA [Legionella pneumophila]ARB91662.1 tRNA pseudouridine(38-40) synthase TruA [Legionella longbeachae]ARM35194.1 tRNA pseudouridine(38-40) synthase TruA [Legionella longbeachae]EEZ95354.1 tRNA pseudouridine synthase A [Legionella longbeachae D-4968]
MRIALVLEYDGSKYHGWQAQTGLHTVQQAVENALSKVADLPISVVCAGRTDTGVHATNQVIHFDSEKQRSIRAWIHGVNSFLPKDICVKWGKELSEEFHARYSATARRYRYVIYNSAIRPALLRSNVTWQYRQLDHRLMHQAAQVLLGENDFTSFRSVECQSNTPMRNVYKLQVNRMGDLVIIDITANAFLHHMVRNIAGVLIAVGSGKRPVFWVEEVLQAKDRRLGAETAPAYGLYLVQVNYPQEFSILQNCPGPMFLLEK